MGSIRTSVTVGSYLEPAHELRCSALVETGTYWVVHGEMCGPLRIRIDGFDPCSGDVHAAPAAA